MTISPKREIAFIDCGVDDLATLLAGIRPDVEPILLSNDEPAPRQMVRAVRGREGQLHKIHVIAHGRSGEVSFGAGPLSLDTMGECAAELADVGRMLRDGAFQLWSCEVAQGARGMAFVNALARATGARVAATSGVVGSAARGGHWELEVRADSSGARAPLTASGIDNYGCVMANNNDSTGVDNITQTSGNDTITITLQADIQANDYFNGGNGTDTVLISSVTGVAIDISSMGINSTTGFHNYESLAFNNTSGTSSLTLNAAQIGTGLISSSLAVTGAGGVQNITVNNASNFSAAAWTFSNWISSIDNIFINGTAGNDTIVGSSQADTIHGGAGNDTITGGGGADKLFGDAGNDTFLIANGNFVAGEAIDGGADNDTISLAGSGATVDFTTGSVVNVENLVGTSGSDSVTMTGAQLNGFGSINLGGGSDTLNITSTSTGLNALSDSALSGVEVISAAGASSGVTTNLSNQTEGFTIIGSNFSDTITGGHGDDVIYGGGNSDVLSGGEGNDLIYGGAGNNTISGGTGNDVLYGGTGNNTISGGDGNDLIIGGNGNDVLHGDAGDDIIYAGNGGDTLYGDAGNDLLIGGNGSDTIYGGDGNDLIIGGKSADTIDGGAGNDVILGTNGSDIIIGGLGSDILSGGSGADKFVYRSAAESPNSGSPDFITDFTHGSDKIDFTSLAISGSGGTLFWSGSIAAAHGVWVTHTGSGCDVVTNIYADTTGDLTPDLHIVLNGNVPIDLSDFLGVGAAVTNHAPVAVADAAAVKEDTNTVAQPNPVSGNVLTNDTDVDVGDTHSVTAVNGAAAKVGVDVAGTYGTLHLNANGTYTYTLNNAQANVQALAEGQTVTDVFSYTNSDNHGGSSSANLTITINGTNDGPVAVADAANGTENQTLTIDVLANDTDVDNGHAFTLVSATAPANQGSASVVSNKVVFNPGTDFDHLAQGASATVTLNYTMKDEFGASSSSSVTVTITGTNDGPVAVADSASGTENQTLTIDVLANDTDVDDGHAFTLVSATAPANQGSASVVSNKVVFNPGTDFDHLAQGASATVTLNYTMKDEFGASSSSSVTITITGTNDAPVITSSAQAGSVQEDTTLTATGQVTSSDVDHGATAAYSGGATGTYGSFAVNAATGVWTYTLDNANHQDLAAGESHTETFTVTVTDDKGATATQDVVITITGTNDAPVITSSAQAGSVQEDTTLTATGQVTSSDVDHGA
ncbi:VCBS domain-containing protein, partial [Bradyrhizobium sp. SSUT77]|uniref:VCBS domain-containing protein n=1 Tax=Bradyrhizobium sp. SSUT77 TaxID=3040603 RepID=UPI0024488DE6